MRGLNTVKRELAQVEAMLARAEEFGPILDNAGDVWQTAAQRVASYTRLAAKLRQERDNLIKVLEKF